MKFLVLSSILVTSGILVGACGDNGSTPIDPATDGGTTDTGTDTGTGTATDTGTPHGATYAVGGSVSGLVGGGLVLQNNGGDDVTVAAAGPFVFGTKLATGAAYAVTVKAQPTGQTCVVSAGTGAVASSAVTAVAIACTVNTYTVGGTVTGLTGAGLVLQDNAGDDLAVAAAGPFTFATKVKTGGAYAVTVKTQPAGQTCVATGAAGTIAAGNITSVAINCVANKYTISGTVTGLAGAGLVLQNNAGDDLTVNGNTFAFATPLLAGAAYAVTVKTQPSGPTQTCTVAMGSGTVGQANVTDVTVTCVTNSYAIGGTTSGLTGSGLVLQDNAADDLAVDAPGGAFKFATPIASGANYLVSVKTQPTAPSQTCVATNQMGKVGGADVTTVTVACITNTFTVGGNVTGLANGESVVLQDNAGDDLPRNANGAFTFATSVASGAAYAVSVKTQPALSICSVTNKSGTVADANVTNVTVTCATATSCASIKAANPGAASGNYTIDPDGGGAKPSVLVYCDMTTDGGGYTYLAVDNAIATSRFDQANTCTAMGLQLAVPRTKAHLNAMFTKYGINYFKIVPGVYGLAAGNYTGCAMNSNNATCSANWKAIDGKGWYAKTAAYSEPNGDYTAGCWLGLDGTGVDATGFGRINDYNCNYSSGTSYICSDNAK